MPLLLVSQQSSGEAAAPLLSWVTDKRLNTCALGIPEAVARSASPPSPPRGTALVVSGSFPRRFTLSQQEDSPGLLETSLCFPFAGSEHRQLQSPLVVVGCIVVPRNLCPSPNPGA